MASKLQEYKDNIEQSLNDKSKPWTKYFELAEQKVGVNRVYIFLGKFFVLFLIRVYLYL